MTLTIIWKQSALNFKPSIFTRINDAFRRKTGQSKMKQCPTALQSARKIDVFKNIKSIENANKILAKRQKKNIKKAYLKHAFEQEIILIKN